MGRWNVLNPGLRRGPRGLSLPSPAKLQFSQGLANFLALLALQTLKPLSNGLPGPPA